MNHFLIINTFYFKNIQINNYKYIGNKIEYNR